MPQYHTQFWQPRVLLQLNLQLSVTCPQTFHDTSLSDKLRDCPLKNLREIHELLAILQQLWWLRSNWKSIRFVFVITWRLLNIPLETPGKKKRLRSTDSEALRVNLVGLAGLWQTCWSLLLIPRGETTTIADATKYLNSLELPLLPQVFPSKNGSEMLIKMVL